jgi:hypothetical protein
MSSPSDLVPLYYISGIGLAVGAAIEGLRRWARGQRERWVREGAEEANLTKTLEDNTKAAAANTAAIGQLVEQMREFSTFMVETRRTLNGHGDQLKELRRLVSHRNGVEKD